MTERDEWDEKAKALWDDWFNDRLPPATTLMIGIAAALRDEYRRGQEEMRERAVECAMDAFLSMGDNPEAAGDEAAFQIRALPLEGEAPGADDEHPEPKPEDKP
jgi:hypothetical protein